jgi:tetratricopeptide (TPR) repeat protein
MDMNNEHMRRIRQNGKKLKRAAQEIPKTWPGMTFFYSSHSAGFLNHVFNPMCRRSEKKAEPEKAPAMCVGAPVLPAGEMPEVADPRSPEFASRPAGLSGRWTVPGVCVFLAAVIWVVFGQTLGYKFVNFDDNAYVYENPEVAPGLTLKGIVRAFTHIHASNWHPLTWISHMLDCQLYGLNPGGHHLTNILLHAATAILLFLVLRRMTGALWRSAFVAAVFAIHPLRVESVAWVAERKDVLSGVFFMLTIGAYVCYVEESKVRGPKSKVLYSLTLVAFALGLMCKPMLVTLPVVLLLLDYWPLGRVAGGEWRVTGEKGGKPSTLNPQLSTLLLEKLPLFGLATASCVITIFAQTEAVRSFEQISLSGRVGNALISYVAYLGQMFWPSDLAVLYPFRAGDVGVSRVGLSLVVLAGISTGVFFLRRRPYFLTGWLWYLIMLVPVIGILQVGLQARADRYTYLPQIGLYLLLTWAAADLCAGWRQRRVVLGGCATIILTALIFCARVQTSYWQNSESLWTHTLACTSDNDIAYNGLGIALLEKGNVDDAIIHFQKALQLNPDAAKVQNNLGNAFLRKGNVDEAISHYQKVLQIRPDYAEIHYNLGNALLRKGSVDDAIVHFQKALQIKPDYTDARFNLGSVLLRRGRVDEAIVQFQKALQIRPDYAEVHYNLGNALFQRGSVDEAISQYQRALQIKPDYAEAHYNLGNAFFQQGHVDEAIAHYQKALEIKPDHAEAHYNLGNALLKEGSVDEAIVHYQKALEIKPGYAEAHYNLGNTFLRKGSMGEAIVHYQKALEIKPNYAEAQNNLAGVLATSPEASLRNGNEAVKLAQQANRLAGGEDPIILGTLAAAYAEAGRFPEAVEAAQRALQLAGTQSNTVLADAIRSQMKLYQAGLPFHLH